MGNTVGQEKMRATKKISFVAAQIHQTEPVQSRGLEKRPLAEAKDSQVLGISLRADAQRANSIKSSAYARAHASGYPSSSLDSELTGQLEAHQNSR